MYIDIPKECKIINVLFSGGVDSTLLLFLLLEQTKESDIPIRCHVMQKRRYQEQASPVIEWLKQNCTKDFFVQFTDKRFFIREFVDNILKTTEPQSFVFSACNKVVTDKFTPTRFIEHDTPPVRGPALNEFHLRPFIDLDKIDICNIYAEKNLLPLFLITYSCGAMKSSACGECYFCLERVWGFENSGLKI